MSGYLELPDGSFLGVRDGLVLGRVAACDVVIDDTKASRKHARIVVDAGVVEIEDLGSSNGTLLNGKPVERRMLRDGDQVQIGKTVIVYREGHVPGTTTHHTKSAAAIFDDDDDLLGGGAPTAAVPPPKPVERPAPPPPAPPPPPPSPPAPVAPPPAPAAPARTVVEFEDEVVEVKKPAPAAAPQAAKAPSSSTGVVASSQRVLQFSKKSGGGGLLGDDLGQMSGGMRALLVLAAIAVGAGVIWGIVTAMR